MERLSISEWSELWDRWEAGVWLDEGGERSGLKGEAEVHRFDRVTDATDRSEIDDPPIGKNKHGSTACQVVTFEGRRQSTSIGLGDYLVEDGSGFIQVVGACP
jgi:hypothetical protein